VPRSVAKRPSKANPVHAGSLAFPPRPVEARFSSRHSKHSVRVPANCRCGGLHPRGMLDHKLADSSAMPFPALHVGREYPLRPNRNPRRHGGGH
jgi:hypothetical protein